MNAFYAKFRRLCAFIVGTVFVLSGVLKLMDPVGAGLVVGDYFNFLHLSFLSFSAKAAGVAFALLEAVLGAALVCGVWRKISAKICWALTGFFTLLTLIFLIVNPQLDCGCFGEVFHLTHLQTFLKNVVLLVSEAVAFIPLKNIGEPKKIKYTSFALAAVSIFLFTVWSLLNIPMKDYTQFKPLTKLMVAATEDDFSFEEDEVSDEDEYPLLAVNTIDGESYDHILAYGKVIVVSMEKKLSERASHRLNTFLSNASEAGFMTLTLSADLEQNSQYVSDYRQLLALNRSNGGASYFSDGVLVKKWHARKYPNLQQLQELYGEDPLEASLEYETKGGLTFEAFLLYLFAVLYLL